MPLVEDQLGFLRDYLDVRPVREEFLADLETPISIYQKLKSGSHSYLLESVEGGERLGRYSFMGIDPLLVIKVSGDLLELTMEGGPAEQSGPVELPAELLPEVIAKISTGGRHPDMPPFYGGAVGFFSYDWVRSLEKLPGSRMPDEGHFPDVYLVVTRVVLIYDHASRKLSIVVLCPAGQSEQDARAEISRLSCRLNRGVASGLPEYPVSPAGRPENMGSDHYSSVFGPEEFCRAVRQIKEYIRAGDVLQVVLSQRLELNNPAEPLDTYRALRSINPSPYMFYLDFPGVKLVGSSPERLVRVQDGLIQYRPIAGTRPRGSSAAEDDSLARELAADEKERAEHLMLVDLGRNDVGRVAANGSVTLPQFMAIERYSHVMHLVSSVHGKLAPGQTAFNALQACFPAGTVSGAPKVRAMEIIDELEPVRRGPYAGAVGYLGLGGNLDTCIAIRTVVFSGGKAYVQVGAGIVSDSDPRAEYQETLNKARALLNALAMAGSM